MLKLKKSYTKIDIKQQILFMFQEHSLKKNFLLLIEVIFNKHLIYQKMQKMKRLLNIEGQEKIIEVSNIRMICDNLFLSVSVIIKKKVIF